MAGGSLRRLTVPLSALAAGVLLLTACSHSDVEYVSNRDAGVFLKLPESWGTFPALDGDVDPSAGEAPGTWRVLFDGSDSPSRSAVEAPQPEAPVGYIEVSPTALVGDAGSIGTNVALRSLLYTTDPLEAAKTDDRVEVVTYEEIELDNGYWGNRLTLRFAESEDNDQTVTQLAFLDRGFERIYLLRIFCTSTCYEEHRAQIDEVLDSWTLRNP